MRSGFACLLYGAPGTGKTETVLQIARAIGRNIMQVNLSELRSMWVGESEKKVKAVFDRYRNFVDYCDKEPILLFNEADGIIAKRSTNAVHAVDQMENTLQNIILQEMETLDGIMMATTNLTQNMDSAFERRFLYKINFHKPETIIPIDMTIVPPWAQQTDDPEPDPNPPPPEVKQEVKPPPKAPEPEKVEVKPKVEAVEKVVEKKKPEKVDLKKNAKLIKKPPKPPPPQKSLKDTAKVITPKPVPVERPPDLKIPDNVKKFGKGTAADKPLSNIDMKKLLEQGYRYGARNQLATSEAQRCVSLIQAAIRREWNKESFKWYSGLRPIQVDFQLGPGGVVRGFAIRSGSGDADVDRTAQSALRRLKANGRIDGLSKDFLEQFPELTIVMEPTQGR